LGCWTRRVCPAHHQSSPGVKSIPDDDYSYYGAESSWSVGKAELVLTEEHGQKAITEFLSGHKIKVPYKSVVLFSNSSYLRLLEY